MKRTRKSCQQAVFVCAIFLIPWIGLFFGGCNSSSSGTPPDTTPPSTPTGLVVTVVSSAQINLSWTASTDNVGVTGYKVQRCSGAGCSNFAQIATTTSTNFTDTGLTASTSYSYRVQATDAANNLSGFSGTSSETTSASSGGPISILITPKRGGVVTSQTILLSATVNNDVGSAGVTWSTTGGTLTGQTSTAATFSSTTAGSFVITAKSNADTTQSASATIGVTDLAGVTTFHNDPARTGANMHEFALTPVNVNTATFGKRFSCAVDSAIYAQPLWIANLTIGGAAHNVVFVASERDTVYAFDADTNPCVTYWKTGAGGVSSLLAAGETWVTSSDVNCNDLAPDIGITGTPVIDPTTNTMYVLTKSKVSVSGAMHQRLHALNLATGAEKFVGPVEIQATVPGNGDGSSGSPPTVSFDPALNGERPALLLENGHIVITWASHCDNFPYHGWVMSYNASTLTQEAVFNTAPNGGYSGIWMSGSGPAADASGNIFFATGNGSWDGMTSFGDSIVKLGPPSGGQFTAANFDYFTPIDQASLNSGDGDLGSGGLLLIPDLPSGPNPRLLVQAGKEGTIYLINRDTGSMGEFCTTCTTGDTQIVQELPGAVGGMWGSPAYWNGNLFFGGMGDNLKAFSFNAGGSGLLSLSPTSQSNNGFGFPGTTPSVSSSASPGGPVNGILWALDTSSCGTLNNCSPGGAAILHAYDATNLATELWNSSQASADQAGFAVKFVVPTVANGKVYIGTSGELDVYGLKPN